ncbi:uncharacterized protein CMC5_067070 [Chondromyces crocatus]|uniref:Uncharacterized protein n=2 Tax=Chondromyces crocatus TaxID=52 RepID=A0A0K1ENQ4_CHOCO|nr:uncharacterized protein CMC5_067070 [Chondromyces crocatus]
MQQAVALLHEQPTTVAAAFLAPLQEKLHDISMKIQTAFESGWLESFQQRLQVGVTRIQAAEAALKNAEGIGRMGWTFPMNVSLTDVVEILLQVPNGPEAIDAAFARFYADTEKQSLPLLLAALRQHARLAEFRALIEEVGFGLEHQKYRLVVTALIPLFEGVARSCWGDSFWQGAARDKFFKDKIATLASDGLDHVMWSATQAFVELLYKKNFHGDPKPRALNRHWILHGRGPADASLVDALRLLQAIYTVVSLADEEAQDAVQAAPAV